MAASSAPRGVSLVEGVVAAALLGLCAAAIISALSFSHFTALRATRMTEALARATDVLEDIAAVPYTLVTTNTYPVKYVTLTNGSAVTLVYAMTTTVTEVSSPLLHKRVYLDYTWRVGSSVQHKRFFALKMP